jgi:hypothetical protein
VHQVERADHASHIAQSRLGSAVLKGAGPMLPTDGRCARLSIGAAAAKLRLSACPPAAPANSKPADSAQGSPLLPVCYVNPSRSCIMHRKEPAAESIEQLTEESDRNSQQWIWPIAGGLGLYGCTRKCTRTRGRAIAWCTQISKRQMMNGHILPRLPAGRARLCC